VAGRVGLVLMQKPLAALLKLPSTQLIVFSRGRRGISGAMGVKRGVCKDSASSRHWQRLFVLESAIKLMAALVLVYVGYGVFVPWRHRHFCGSGVCILSGLTFC